MEFIDQNFLPTQFENINSFKYLYLLKTGINSLNEILYMILFVKKNKIN